MSEQIKYTQGEQVPGEVICNKCGSWIEYAFRDIHDQWHESIEALRERGNE